MKSVSRPIITTCPVTLFFAMYLCVQCGEGIPNLFVEYSATNLRLTRCPNCHNVADKYIEYELVLVLIDILLLRTPAYRHLLYNRYDYRVSERMQWFLPFAVLITSACLKVVILLKTYYKPVHFSSFLHALLVSCVEYACFGLGLALSIPFLPRHSIPFATNIHNSSNNFLSSSGSSSVSTDNINVSSGPSPPTNNNRTFYSRLYLAVLFPEAFRITALVLHTFDTEPSLLLMLGMFIGWIQFVAFQSVLPVNGSVHVTSSASSPTVPSTAFHPPSSSIQQTLSFRLRLLIGISFLIAMGAKIVSKMWFYSHNDIWLLGGFT